MNQESVCAFFRVQGQSLPKTKMCPLFSRFLKRLSEGGASHSCPSGGLPCCCRSAVMQSPSLRYPKPPARGGGASPHPLFR